MSNVITPQTVPFEVSEDGEEWRPIPGFCDYEVSSWGRARSTCRYNDPNAVLKPFTMRGGYQQVSLRSRFLGEKKVQIHRLVAFAFLPPSSNGRTIINHKDGNPMNNRPENLEWVNYAQNYHHGVALRNGYWLSLSPV